MSDVMAGKPLLSRTPSPLIVRRRFPFSWSIFPDKRGKDTRVPVGGSRGAGRTFEAL